MKTYVAFYCKYLEKDLYLRLKQFAEEHFGSQRCVSEALNFILREFFKNYDGKSKKLPKANKRTIKLLLWLYENHLKHVESDEKGVWIDWNVIKNFIMKVLGVRSRPALRDYYNYLKQIASDFNESKRSKALFFNKFEIERILKAYGYDLEKLKENRKNPEKQRIKITKTETKTFEIETEGNVSLKDVIAYALELREQGYSLDEIEDKVKDLGFDIPKRNLRGMMRRDMRDYDPFV